MVEFLRICSSSEMRNLDAEAESHFGIESAILMENAGRAAAQVLLEQFEIARKGVQVLVFAGKGNNAGDAFVMARRLFCLDIPIRVFHLEPESGYRGASLKNFLILKKLKVKLSYLETASELSDFFQNLSGPFVLVDGILGTGLHSPLEGVFYDVVEMINQQNCQHVLALDIPTGVDGDTGIVRGAAIQASLTVSFGFPKLGHFLPPGASYRGKLIHVDISLPRQFSKTGQCFLLMKSSLAKSLSNRDPYGHKNTFGHTLLVGGSLGKTGAITLATRACHKMGTGLVTASTWEESFDHLLYQLPHEAMAIRLSQFETALQEGKLEQYSSIVIGPGFGQRSEGIRLLEGLIESYTGALLIDADALHWVGQSSMAEKLSRRSAPTLLTPHPGEMSSLLGVEKNWVLQNPMAAVQKAVDLTQTIVLLKGATTWVSSPDGIFYLQHHPNDGMATAGSGDVLAGMIGGLLGQKMKSLEATLLGLCLHSIAGDWAAKKHGHRSMTAPDLIENIGNAFHELETTEFTHSVEGRLHLY